MKPGISFTYGLILGFVAFTIPFRATAVAVDAPAGLAYSTNPAVYTVGTAITDNASSSTGGAVDSYSITPSLPAGLSLDTGSGVISGTPTALSAATDYTVTATNSGGSATVTVSITVNNDVAPSALTYATNPAVYTVDAAITDNEPSSTGGAVVSYSITPSLPAGLSLDTGSGVISGTPGVSSAATDYTVTATNSGGSATVTVSITVNNDVAPSALSYATNPAVYTVGTAITDNVPSSTGGAVVTYSISPALPAGLSLDTASGVISGTPGVSSAATDYTVTATNSGGSATVTVSITVNNDVAPSALSYPTNPAVYTKSLAITNNSPSSTGGAVVSYSISPALPAGLGLDTGSGVISGTPTALSAEADYTVTATNTGGSATVSLTITVNDVAPSALSYANNPAIYTKGVAITNNTPSSAGGAVVTYSITPSLPTGLSFDTASGVISGTPVALSAATDYMVTATNTGGSATVTLRITVNDVVILLEGKSGSRDMAVTFNGSGWTTTGSTDSAFNHGAASVANSSHSSLSGSNREGVKDDGVEGNPFKGAVSSGKQSGQYVPLASSISFSATNTTGPSSFNIIGLLLDDDGTGGTDDFWLVTDQPASTTWPSGTAFSFTGGSWSTFSLDSGVDADFDEAMNVGSYTLDGSTLKGTLEVAVAPDAPADLAYATNPAIYTKDVAITDNVPSSTGGAVVVYSIAPSLPAGLSLDTSSGVISGTPSAVSAATDYTVRATNTGGSTTVTVSITVNNDVAPSALTYATNPAVYTVGTAITDNVPSSTGGAVVTYSISPSLPAGLSLDTGSGVISGTPGVSSAATDYTVTATNSGGSATVTVSITVNNDVAPSALSYATNPAVYTVGTAITDNSPSSTGGAVVSYSISPALPAGLGLDTGSGVISGTPTELSAEADYTVTATNTGGSATVSLTITVNDMAPSALSYANNPAIYTKGVAITNNAPSSAGGAVVTYSITPSLPTGLSLDTATGVISGTPSALSTATSYTVTATNSGGSATVTLRMTVNDVQHVVILLEGTDDSRDMRVTFNGTGSWTTSGSTASAFTYGDSNVANSSNASLGGETKEGIEDVGITGGNAMNAALSGSFTGGQYVALATPIAMTADGGPSSFNVIGLLFGDDSDPTAGQDDVILVTDQADTSSWPSATEISYTVGASTTFSLDSGIGATFDEAFNKDIYTLDEGVVGSLKIAETVAPAELAYSVNSAVYTVGLAITDNVPSSTGSAVDSYSITPSLPAGLSLDTGNGVISGTPTALSAVTDYTVTATNTGGSATVTVSIMVNDVAPSALTYATNPAVYTVGVAISDNASSSTGGAVVSYSIVPSLPAGLSLDTGSGVISGTPSELSAATDYTVGATNTGGSAAVTVRITVNDVAPSALSYATNPAVYTVDAAITDNEPSSTGGAVVSYSITPSLPAGLSLDTGSGVISGTPGVSSAATDYTVTATNSGGSATVTVSITVNNDVAPSALSYATNPAVYTVGTAITDNSPSSTGGAVVTYSISPALPAGLDLDTGSGVISGTPGVSSAATDYTVTATNSGGSATVTVSITVNNDVAPSALSYATNPAVYTKSLAITNNSPSSTGGAVVTYSITPSLPAGLSLDTGSGVISGTPGVSSAATDYTVTATNSGGSATVTVSITVNNDVAPSALSYATNPAVYTVGTAITDNVPSSTGGAVVSYSISPALPAGLGLDTGSGVISGTPTELSAEADYTVTATNTGGSATVSLTITVNDVAPSALSYADNPAIYTKGVAITNNTPSSAGGTVVTYSITPSLPTGLSFDTASGVISGTPVALSAATDYMVTATNTGGSATVTLRITVNDVAPSNLSYTTNPAIYTKDVAITDNTPSSAGGAVVTYSITPSLPTGLSLDTATGVISGTPSALSTATSYTVTATNSGGSATVTLRMTVNDVQHVVILLEGTDDSRDMRVTFNGTGSWTTSGSTASAFTYGDSNVANSSDASLGGSSKEGFHDYLITGGNAMNAALSGSFTNGQYVALATPIAMTADGGPSSFNVIGLLFDDDSDPTAGQDDVILVTDQADTSSWPSATEISYTVGASTTFSLDSGIGATFDEAFNKDIYTLNDGVVGSLKIAETVAPAELVYSANSAVYTAGVAITDNVPSSTGSAVDSYSITPSLPAGLSLDTGNGVISGTPTALSAPTDYTVTATNTGGSATVTVSITVNDVAPAQLTYAANPAVYTVGMAITDNASSSTGGAVVSYSISPALPAGLSFDAVSGVISGTPSELNAATDYTVTATNTGGSATVTVRITVNDVAPAQLSYATNPAIYTVGTAITDNEPSSTGGAVVTYSITPSLPAGLSLDTATGVISGTPGVSSAATDYTVTATNTGGSATATVSITVNDVAPSALIYATNPAVYTVGVAITDNSPSSTGGAVVSYSISPALPAGLSLDTGSGVISGTPSELSAATDYTVTATNTEGSATATVRITVNDVAPSALYYATNPAIYTKDVAITDNEPSSTGGGVVSYSITPSLPAGLSFDTGSGVISGTPTDPSAATDYTVTATNSGGLTTVTLRMTVNAVQHVTILLEGTDGSRNMTVTFNGTGSWTPSRSTVSAFSYGASKVANSSHSSLRGSSREAFADGSIGDPFKSAMSRGKKNGQYVPFANPIAFTANRGPASFSAIGLLFDDDTQGSDDIKLVTNRSSSKTWAAGTTVSYTVGSSTTFSLDAGVGADFDEAMNVGIYTLNKSLDGTLQIAVAPDAPDELAYFTNPAIYTKDEAITDNEPSSTGGAVVSYSIAPSLPAGLSLDPGSGVISGTPTELSAATDYTVTATNSGGSATVTVSITVYDVASLRIIVEDATPSALSYAMNPANYTVGEAITDNMPSSTGGAVVVYSITPALPAGLSLDMGSGVISGTPTEPGEAREYTVTATNSGGSTMTVVTITVKGRHPQYTNSGPFNVAENSVNGTLAGDADANDADGGTKDVGVTYSIQSGNDSVDGDATPAFGLDPDTGVLTVRDQDDLDHETQSSFALVIRATDGDGFTDVIVTIQVDNVPEAPVSTGLAPVHVMIGATDSVIDLATVFSDEEDADLSYSISSNSNTELFTSVGIDEETDRLILDFAPNIAGTATLEITATDSDGQSVSASLVVTVSGDALEEWRRANFSAVDLGDPAKEATLWGNSANPDEDLWSNAFEFFFGTDPNSFDESYPMTYEVRQVGLDGFAVLEFERSKAMPAGVGVVEGSGDLSQWQVVRAPAVVMEDLGDRERVQVRIPLEEQAKQSFVRLVVDLGMN